MEQDPARGRLADGRAFRTDAEGNQLVDYIAELELSVEQLNRRVNGLEFELSEKQAQVERLSKSGAKEVALQEKDLMKSPSTKSPQFAPQNKGTNAAPTDRAELVMAMAQEPDRDCSAEVSGAQQQLEKVRFDLDVAQRVGNKYRDEAAELRKKLENEQQTLQGRIAQIRSESKLTCPDRSIEISQLQNELKERERALREQQKQLVTAQAGEASQLRQVLDFQTKLKESESRVQMNARLVSDLQNRVQERDSLVQVRLQELEKRNSQLQATQQDLEAMKLKTAKAEALLANERTTKSAAIEPQLPALKLANKAEPPRVVEAAPVQLEVKPKLAVLEPKKPDQKASFSAAKMRAVDSLRGTLQGDLLRLRDMVRNRDNLFQNYNQAGQKVTFKPSALVSSRNNSLSWITERIKSSTTVHELSSLSADIRDIKARVQGDIELIKRMQKNR
jgi:hypothetical protein